MSSERNHLSNGRFLHDLDNWTASGAEYSAGDGDDHYGVAVLSSGGGYIEQAFSLAQLRSYTLNLSVKAVGGDLSAGQATVRITDGDGSIVTTQNLSGTGDTWTDNAISLGLAPGTTYTVRITNVSAGDQVKVDDVWLWFVPITRANIAAAVNRKLGRVATDRSYSTAASGAQTEGDYTDAVDDALRSLGAINPETGLVDVRWLDENLVKSAIDTALQAMLERAAIDYGVEVDISLGPHSERLSQKREAVEKLAGLVSGVGGGGGGNQQVTVRRLRHPRRDYAWDE